MIEDAVRAGRQELAREWLSRLPAINERSSAEARALVTRSGALLFGEDPTAVIPTAIVQCTHVHGSSLAAPMDKTDLRGTIPEQVVRARDFVARLVQRGEAPTEDDATTHPVYDYPMVAVREILANALVHRDYEHQQVCV